jgi:glycosyltransferase involved in cell wall biosynthesis
LRALPIIFDTYTPLTKTLEELFRHSTVVNHNNIEWLNSYLKYYHMDIVKTPVTVDNFEKVLYATKLLSKHTSIGYIFVIDESNFTVQEILSLNDRLRSYGIQFEIELFINDHTKHMNLIDLLEITNLKISYAVDKQILPSKATLKAKKLQAETVYMYSQHIGPQHDLKWLVEAQKCFKKTCPNLSISGPFKAAFRTKWHNQQNTFEPVIKPRFFAGETQDLVDVSVIIPTYNNSKRLCQALAFNITRTPRSKKFEYIIVDDGSDDSTDLALKKLIKNNSIPENIEIKYLYFPREVSRSMGDRTFRAGKARNLGAANAKGDILCFLDSDIIVTGRYFESVEKSLETHKFCQGRRLRLKEKMLPPPMSSEVERKIIDNEDPYWSNFHKINTLWSNIPNFWKFACTHSFSVKRVDFWEVGGISPYFTSYGFEDTDLGYRLYKSGGTAELLNEYVFHLHQSAELSEDRGSRQNRDFLLATSAKVFYQMHLDDEILAALRFYLTPNNTRSKVKRWVQLIKDEFAVK